MTINQYLEVDRYPLPKPNDLFATLAGGQKFSNIDLSQAYQQLALEEESCELVVINTHCVVQLYTPSFRGGFCLCIVSTGNGLYFARHSRSDLLY